MKKTISNVIHSIPIDLLTLLTVLLHSRICHANFETPMQSFFYDIGIKIAIGWNLIYLDDIILYLLSMT